MSPVQKPIESLPTLSTKDVPRKEAQQGLAEPQVSSTKPPSCTKEKLKLTRAALSKCARRTGSGYTLLHDTVSTESERKHSETCLAICH